MSLEGYDLRLIYDSSCACPLLYSGTTEHREKAKLSTRSGGHQILLVFGINDINSHIQILSNINKLLSGQTFVKY